MIACSWFGADAESVLAQDRPSQAVGQPGAGHPNRMLTGPALPQASSVVVLVGLAFEARIARGPGVLVVCRAPEREMSRTLQAALRGGCRSIISFGVAGGLSADLQPGDCVVASGIADASTLWPADPLWSRTLLEAVPGARHGVIVGADSVVADPSAKRDLHAQTGAVAVDMESHLVARLAAAHGLSFATLRVVIDPADRAVPPAAQMAMRRDGGTDLTSFMRELMVRPSQVMALLRIASDAYAARCTLLRLRRTLGPAFGVSRLSCADEFRDRATQGVAPAIETNGAYSRL
jgi:hopanoid-associated phosphorylase